MEKDMKKMRRQKSRLMISALIFSFFLFFELSNSYAAKIVLLTRTQNNAPPRYFVKNGISTGICVDMIDELNIRLEKDNISIKTEKGSLPLRRLMKYLENGTIDIVVGLSKNKKRENKFHITIPIYPLTMSFAKRQADPFEYTDIDSLRGVKIGTLGGASSSKTMKKIDGAYVSETTTIEQALKKLKAGRINLVFYHNLGLSWQIKEFNLSNDLLLVKNPFLSKGHHIAISKKVSPDVVSKINMAIKSMRSGGVIDKILAKYK